MKRLVLALFVFSTLGSCSGDGPSPGMGQGGDMNSDSWLDPRTLADGAIVNPNAQPPQKCASDRDCPSNICLQELASGVCAEPCDGQGGCYKADWGCFPIYDQSGPAQPLCLPNVAVLCMPCTTDDDCSTLNDSFLGHCLPLATEGSFCGFSCIAHDDCPEGYVCKAFDFGDGLTGQCQPKIEQCVCNEVGKRTAWTIDCAVENEFGSCLGTNQCPPAGSASCTAAVPADDVCNNLDDNCDGEVDNWDALGTQCGDSNKGECKLGKVACVDGVETCEGAVLPTDEVCDGLDNDCDWAADEEYPEHLKPCGIDTGECKFGTYLCQQGKLICVDDVGPEEEVCDGKDNDCNGEADDGVAGGEQCGSDVGECSFGEEACLDGKWTCVGGQSPGEEVCNGKDDDCDGTIDLPACED